MPGGAGPPASILPPQVSTASPGGYSRGPGPQTRRPWRSCTENSTRAVRGSSSVSETAPSAGLGWVREIASSRGSAETGKTPRPGRAYTGRVRVTALLSSRVSTTADRVSTTSLSGYSPSPSEGGTVTDTATL